MRSYQFEHFKAGPEPDHRGQVGDKERFARSREHPLPEKGLRYGKRFAETEALYRAQKGERKAAMHVEAARRTSPIGSLPAPEKVRPLTLQAAAEEARCRARSVIAASRELIRAGMRLGALPFEVARIAARRLRPKNAT